MELQSCLRRMNGADGLVREYPFGPKIPPTFIQINDAEMNDRLSLPTLQIPIGTLYTCCLSKRRLRLRRRAIAVKYSVGVCSLTIGTKKSLCFVPKTPQSWQFGRCIFPIPILPMFRVLSCLGALMHVQCA